MASPSPSTEAGYGVDAETGRGPLLLISSDFPPVSGGQSRYLFDLWSQLPAAEVLVLAPKIEGAAAVDAGVLVAG